MGLFKKEISYEDLSLFCRQLSLVLESDLSMQQGIKTIGGETGSGVLKNTTARIREDLNKGLSLYEAVRIHEDILGGFLIEMIGVGEKSGNLPAMLRRTADSMDRKIETARKLKSSVIYPAVLALLMLAVIILLLIFVLPIFEDIYMSMGGEMPRITEGLMSFGDFVSGNIIIILAVLAAVAIAVYALAKNGVAKPFRDKLKFKFPLTGGILRARVASDLALNLAMLIRSGINTTMAVEMLVPLIENGHIGEKLEKAARNLAEGAGPHKAFESLGLYPELLLRLIAVAGETGRLDTTFERVSMVMGREAERRTENLIALLEPLLIILLSVLVGFILISVILPVTGIMNAIG